MEAGVEPGGQLQLERHGGLAVVDKEGMRPHPAGEQRVAGQAGQEARGGGQLALAGDGIAQLDNAVANAARSPLCRTTGTMRSIQKY